jgi:hypothetical protein
MCTRRNSLAVGVPHPIWGHRACQAGQGRRRERGEPAPPDTEAGLGSEDDNDIVMSNQRQKVERPSGPLDLRHASTEHPLIVVVPDRRLLVIEGVGYPRAADFRSATTILRTVEDLLRARLRHDGMADSPRTIVEIAWRIEPGWSTDDILAAFTEPTAWHWRQMVEVPHALTEVAVVQVIDEARRQGGRDVPLVRMVQFAEGRAAQILQLGGPGGESGSVGKLYRFVADSGLRPRGDLHQLVLADPDVVPRERARSIFRLPIETDRPVQ